MAYKFEYESKNTEPVVRFKRYVGASVPTEHIENIVTEGINKLRDDTEEGLWYSWSGDTLVLVLREDEKLLQVVVASPRMTAEVEI
jgi:hypothetical protein